PNGLRRPRGTGCTACTRAFRNTSCFPLAPPKVRVLLVCTVCSIRQLVGTNLHNDPPRVYQSLILGLIEHKDVRPARGRYTRFNAATACVSTAVLGRCVHRVQLADTEVSGSLLR